MTKKRKMKRKLISVIETTNQKASDFEELLRVQQAERDAQLAEITRLEEEQKLALEEEQKMIEDLAKQINELCAEKGLWCGVKLSKETVLNIVSAIIDDNKPVEIPFVLYFDDRVKEEPKEEIIEEDTTNAIDEASVIQQEIEWEAGTVPVEEVK